MLERRIGQFAALANLDAPVHRERRGALKAQFTPAKAAELRERCIVVCRAALEPVRDGQSIDVAVDDGLRVSVAMVSELLGIPQLDRSTIADWSDGSSSGRWTPTPPCRSTASALLRRSATAAAPAKVVRSYLEVVDESGRPMSDEDLGAHLREILIGGAETNPKALGATVARLAANPDQRSEVAGRPEWASAAFLEARRIDTPGQFIGVRWRPMSSSTAGRCTSATWPSS